MPLTGLDAELSAHCAAALTRYGRWLDDVGRPLPDGYAELLAELVRVVNSGQSHPVDAATRHRLRMAHLVTTTDAAALLGVSERTVRRRVADGRLPAHRIGRLVRFDPVALLDALEAA